MEHEVNLEAWLADFSRHIISGQSYREPTTKEVTGFLGGLEAIVRGELNSPLISNVGFTVKHGVDGKTERQFVLLYNEYGTDRAWGAYLIDLTVGGTVGPVRGLIEAPHIVFDTNTEKIALELWRAYPGTLLLISGSHRTDTSFNNLRDVAHQPGSLFHQVALAYARRGVPQFQQHGFANSSDPQHDIIISTGDAATSNAIRRLADSLETTGFRVARSWDRTETDLDGMENAQGAAAEANDAVFAHVEVNHTVRTTPELREKYIRAVADAHFFDF